VCDIGKRYVHELDLISWFSIERRSCFLGTLHASSPGPFAARTVYTNTLTSCRVSFAVTSGRFVVSGYRMWTMTVLEFRFRTCYKPALLLREPDVQRIPSDSMKCRF
jgi:hypothetical protein